MRHRVERHTPFIARRGVAEAVGQPRLGKGAQHEAAEKQKVENEPGAQVGGCDAKIHIPHFFAVSASWAMSFCFCPCSAASSTVAIKVRA